MICTWKLIVVVAADYLGTGQAAQQPSRKSVNRPQKKASAAPVEPLTYEKKVYRASLVAAALFTWTATALLAAGAALPSDAIFFPLNSESAEAYVRSEAQAIPPDPEPTEAIVASDEPFDKVEDVHVSYLM